MVGAERLLPIVIVGFKANLEKVPPFSKRCSISEHTPKAEALCFFCLFENHPIKLGMQKS